MSEFSPFVLRFDTEVGGGIHVDTVTCKQLKKMSVAALICVVCLVAFCQSAVVPQNKAECGYGVRFNLF